MTRTITFQPSENQSRLIESLLQSGGFNNQSEIIRAGLRLLEENHVNSKVQQLKKLIAEGENSGDLVAWDAKEFLASMKNITHD